MSDEARVYQSIHPGGRPAKNTCAKKQRGTVERVIKGIEKHLAKHPGDNASKEHLKLCRERLNACPS